MNAKSIFRKGLLTLSIAGLSVLTGCSSNIGGATQPPTATATPTFSLAAGTYIGTQTVTISDATGGATIYYTTNGTTPTTSSERYIDPIMVTASETIETIAVATGYLTSGLGTASYTVTPGSPNASVTISLAPPLSVRPGQGVAVGATVSNGASGVGVLWGCAPAGICGTFSPTITDNGSPATYTGPLTSPPGGYVTIFAYYLNDFTKMASVSTVITGLASNETLTGQYAFFLTSPTGTHGTMSVGGSITLDGSGNVESGVLDIMSPGVLDLEDPILPTSSNPPPLTSAYTIDTLGRGTLMVRTANGKSLVFSLALTSPSHALLAEIDGNPGSGTLDLQQHPGGSFAASQVVGAYSFTMTGTVRTNAATKVSIGGIFSSDGIATVSGGLLDVNTAGAMSSSPFGGTFSAPDSNGRGTMQLSVGKSFIYYIISSRALRIFEADNASLMGGSAYSQGGSVIFIANECVYQHSGWTASGLTTTAGEFYLPEGESDITGGISDSNTGSSPAIPKKAIAVLGSFKVGQPNSIGSLSVVDAAGSSTFNLYVVDPAIDILDPNNSGPSLPGPGEAGNALLLHTDANINGTGVLFQRVGQDLAPFLANYAIQLTNSTITNSSTDELDLAGVVSADSFILINGLVDYDRNASSSPIAVLGAPVTGSFGYDAEHVRHATGSITIPTPATASAYPFISPSVTTFGVSYYQISVTEAFALQTDSSASSFGYLSLQLFP